MENSVVVSHWSVDAIKCLSGELFHTLSVELISRIENFISSFVLFDTIYVNEQYENREFIKALNLASNNAIKFIKSADLKHSDNMSNEITFDIPLHKVAFEDLSKENNTWFFQHDPDLGKELFFSQEIDSTTKEFIDNKFFTNLRLWVWCLMNEMAEKTNSICMIPKSLEAISKYNFHHNRLHELVLNDYLEYTKIHHQRFLKLTETISEEFIYELSYVPPLFAVFLNRCKHNNDIIPTLIKLREDYQEFRLLRHKFTTEISQSTNIKDKQEIAQLWDKSWQILTKGEFKKPQLLKHKFSSTDISSIIIDAKDIFDKIEIKELSPKILLRNFFDYLSYKKSYQQFRIFSSLNDEIEEMSTEVSLLKKNFAIKDIVPIITIK